MNKKTINIFYWGDFLQGKRLPCPYVSTRIFLLNGLFKQFSEITILIK